MSENQTKDETSKPEPSWWKPYWIIIAIVTIVVGLTLPFTRGMSWEQAIALLVFFLGIEVVAYYARVQVFTRLNRIMYLLIGVCIGCFLWIGVTSFLRMMRLRWPGGDMGLFVSVVLCFGIGVLIGELIGKARNYKGPWPHQP